MQVFKSVAIYRVNYYNSMGQQVKKIHAESMKPGMRLARGITNEGGITLFSEGTTLSEAQISRIHDMHIDAVYVEGSSAPAVPIEEELAMLDARFKRAENDSNMLKLKNTVRQYIQTLYE